MIGALDLPGGGAVPVARIRASAARRRPGTNFLPFSGLSASRAWAAALAVFAASTPALAQDAPRLLTGLTAEAGSDGVALAWTVDESRADRIAGFSCVFRTPGHLKLGVSGAVPCGPENSPPAARGHVVSGLPEYGEYLFEVVAETNSAGPGVPWPERALHVRLAVTEELAGPPGVAVTGAGPLVAGCGPDDKAAGRPWRLDDIVSVEHLSHPPSQGWVPGGNRAVTPDWPEPTPFSQLMDAAAAEAALAGETEAVAAAVRAVLARADRTRALLRPGAAGGWELKLHSSYPFGAVYAYAAEHAVTGWAEPGHAAFWPGLWNRTSCPPPEAPDATHDVTLALADAAGDGRRLRHSGYGWWTVAPVGVRPERVVAAKAGLSWGAPALEAPGLHVRWRGRLTGHLFRDRRRWALAGDVALESGLVEGRAQLSGRIENVVLAALDAKSVEPATGAPGRLPDFVLEAGPAEDAGWSGAVRFAAAEPGGAPAGFPEAAAFRGDWQAAAHGPDGQEIAGRLRLWTPLAAGADPDTDWPGQAVLVAGFGGVRAQ